MGILEVSLGTKVGRQGVRMGAGGSCACGHPGLFLLLRGEEGNEKGKLFLFFLFN